MNTPVIQCLSPNARHRGRNPHPYRCAYCCRSRGRCRKSLILRDLRSRPSLSESQVEGSSHPGSGQASAGPQYDPGMWSTHLLVTAVTFGAMLLGAGVLHLLPRLGPGGRAVSGWLTRAPGLDLAVTYFTVAPLVFGPIVDGWWGLLSAVIGQVLAVLVWCRLHELVHPSARRGPRIVKSLNRIVGPVRNHAGLWVTAVVAPAFWLVRVVEILIWPCLVVVVGFPRYREGEWVNCSRHKFQDLVGHDLIWCLYCDWMTGIWSLGTEMLRNVESWWCPIQFPEEKKCENCRREFPDLEGGWVAADASMADVAQTLEDRYLQRSGPNAWFGHPTRSATESQDEPGEA